MRTDLFDFDHSLYAPNARYIAGIDEAGRGPWAGPVVAAAVVLPQGVIIPGLNDSKKLSPQKRDKIFDHIQASALGIGVGIADHAVIDAENILQATFRAMREALSRITLDIGLVLVDGSQCIPGIPAPQRAVISGDAKSACIAAASVVAKVTRDRMMAVFAEQYPLYSFDRHKGYGTAEHSAALRCHGPCPIHRRSFSPVRAVIEERHEQP